MIKLCKAPISRSYNLDSDETVVAFVCLQVNRGSWKKTFNRLHCESVLTELENLVFSTVRYRDA